MVGNQEQNASLVRVFRRLKRTREADIHPTASKEAIQAPDWSGAPAKKSPGRFQSGQEGLVVDLGEPFPMRTSSWVRWQRYTTATAAQVSAAPSESELVHGQAAFRESRMACFVPAPLSA